MKAETSLLREGNLLERPLGINDPPRVLPEIRQAEIVAFSTALHVLRLAQADFEAKRGALTLKLLRVCSCEEGSYFASLDECSQIVIEDHTSLEPVTRRPLVDRESVPSFGPA